MKLTLTLILLSAVCFGQIRYSPPRTMYNVRTVVTPRTMPLLTDVSGSTIVCYGDSCLYIKRNGQLVPAFIVYPYSPGAKKLIQDRSIFPQAKYSIVKKQYTVVVNSIPGNLPILAEAKYVTDMFYNDHDSLVYAKRNGTIDTVAVCFPYAPIVEIEPVYTSPRNFYFAEDGNDSYSAEQTHSSATPWKTIAKLNSYMANLMPGDSILFKRGDSFTGTITVTKSGTAANPIIFGAYGSGVDPIITGFTTVSGWTSEGSGIYSKVITSASQSNMVTVDGVQYGMGRTPNTGTYLTYESASTNVSITDNQLTGTPNWTGAEAVITKNGWLIDRCPITNHVGSTITATVAVSGNYTAPNNYFIQNDIRTLDQFGEWYHDFTTGKFYMYFGDVNPDTKTVKVATINQLASCINPDYITIDNISFVGSIAETIKTANSDGSIIQNCNVSFSGKYGISLSGIGWTVNNNTITDCNSVAIYQVNGSTVTINNNTITNSGIIEGQGNLAPAYGSAISVSVNNFSVNNNSITNCGYDGIRISAGAMSGNVSNNVITNPCLLRYDQGGIYSSGGRTSIIVNGNIIANSMGSGIYFDEYSTNANITSNTVSGSAYYGIKLHKANHNTVSNNTLFDNSYGIHFENWLNENNLGYNTIKNNVSVAKEATQYPLSFITRYTDYLTLLATCDFDSNYYARPVDDNLTIYINVPGLYGVTRTLSQWQTFSSQDANSKQSPFAATQFLFDYSITAKTVSGLSGWKDLDNNTVNSYTLAPYESIILIK